MLDNEEQAPRASVTQAFNRASDKESLGPEKLGPARPQTKYTYFLPVHVSADGILEFPPEIAQQIRMQAMTDEKMNAKASNLNLEDGGNLNLAMGSEINANG